MGDVHVPDFKASTLSGQTTRAKGRHTTFVRDLGQRVGLVHELRQLRRSEELFQGCRNRLAVDQVMGHERLLLGLAKPFFNRFFNTGKTGSVLVFSQFAHATHAAITEVVDVIDVTTAIAQVHQDLHHRQDIFIGQHHRAGRLGPAHLGVELHATHARQVIGVGVVEQALKQRLYRVFGGWLAGTHHAVDGNPGGKLVHGFITAQGLRNVRALIELIRVDARQVLHAGCAQFFQQSLGQFLVGLGDDFTGVGFDDVAGHDSRHQKVFRYADVCGP